MSEKEEPQEIAKWQAVDTAGEWAHRDWNLLRYNDGFELWDGPERVVHWRGGSWGASGAGVMALVERIAINEKLLCQAEHSYELLEGEISELADAMAVKGSWSEILRQAIDIVLDKVPPSEASS